MASCPIKQQTHTTTRGYNRLGDRNREHKQKGDVLKFVCQVQTLYIIVCKFPVIIHFKDYVRTVT